jgi:citrate lyase gamma subunit
VDGIAVDVAIAEAETVEVVADEATIAAIEIAEIAIVIEDRGATTAIVKAVAAAGTRAHDASATAHRVKSKGLPETGGLFQ